MANSPPATNGLKNALKAVPGLVPCVRWARERHQEYQLWRARQPSHYASQIEQYLSSPGLKKLHIGAGPHELPGWLNTDYFPYFDWTVFLDGTKPFPLPANTFDYAFSEHMIEHITFEDGQQMLRETFRVLKPGGAVRIATPNLQALVELFTENKTDAQRRYIDYTMGHYFPELKTREEGFVLNNFVRNWGHLFVYDPATLRFALERVGFTRVQHCEVGQSDDEHLRGLECHGKQIGEEWNRFETMALEATKPA